MPRVGPLSLPGLPSCVPEGRCALLREVSPLPGRVDLASLYLTRSVSMYFKFFFLNLTFLSSFSFPAQLSRRSREVSPTRFPPPSTRTRPSRTWGSVLAFLAFGRMYDGLYPHTASGRAVARPNLCAPCSCPHAWGAQGSRHGLHSLLCPECPLL